mmetsp:Transcript_6691/g.15746  ORF Transcript_6691/g.15746 Transcript_6691/m.15746 type:complete len:107 (-) Transcript_6691:358-678(-)
MDPDRLGLHPLRGSWTLPWWEVFKMKWSQGGRKTPMTKRWRGERRSQDRSTMQTTLRYLARRKQAGIPMVTYQELLRRLHRKERPGRFRTRPLSELLWLHRQKMPR